MIIQDIPGYILCIENLMCSQLLLNLKPLLKNFSPPQSNKPKPIMVANLLPTSLIFFLTIQGIYHRLTCPHTSQQKWDCREKT